MKLLRNDAIKTLSFFLLYFFSNFFYSLFAQPVLIGKFSEILEDKSKKLSIQEILSLEVQNQFEPYFKDVILKHTFDYAYWVKIPLQSSHPTPLWLQLATENIWYIDLYDLKNGNYELTYSTGALRPSSTKIQGSYLLPILEFTGSKTIYLRLETGRLLEAPIYLGKLEEFLAIQKYDYYAFGTFFGLQIGLLIYSLLLLNVSSKSFLWFVGYSITSIFAISFINHHTGMWEYLGDELLWFLHKNYFSLFGILLFFITNYSISFLKLKTLKSLYYVYIILKFLGLVFGLGIPLCGILFSPLRNLLYQYYPFILNLSVLVILGISYYVQKYTKEKSIRFFTLSWIVVSLSGLIHFALKYGWLGYYNFFFSNILYFGVAIGSIFIVLAITQRLFQKQRKNFVRKRKIANFFYRKKLKQSIDELEELIQIIPIGLYRYSKLKEGILKFKYVSPKWCEIVGLNQEEVLKDASLVNQFFHPDDFDSFVKANSYATMNHTKFMWEGRIIVNNRTRFLHIESYPVEKENGDVDWIGIQYDITDKKIQEQNLQLFAKLAQNTSDVVIITNKAGLVVWVNPSFYEVTGYTLQEAFGKKPGDLLQGPNTDPETKLRLHNAIQNVQPIREIILNYNKAGEPFWIDLAIDPIFDEHGECCNFIGIQRNVTNQKEENLYLKKAFKEIEEENSKVLRYVHEKSQLLAVMSHEIRTPLTAIMGFTEILSDTLQEESQKNMLENIQIASTNLMELINNILDYSKIEAGKVDLHFFEVKPSEMIEDCLLLISQRAEKKNLKIIKNIDPQIPSKLFLDTGKIKQVLINLLSNAVKFTMKGEIEVGIKLVSHEPELGLVDLTFYVRDEGIGIAEENQKIIFEEFTQEDSNIQVNFGGTGLGLTICNQLLEFMGSKLELKSKKGKGSIFYFTILAKQELVIPFSLETNQSSPTQLEKIDLKDLEFKVLVVDDLDVNRFLLVSMMKNLLPKAVIHEASDGLEAIEVYKKESPELILVDI